MIDNHYMTQLIVLFFFFASFQVSQIKDIFIFLIIIFNWFSEKLR